MTEVKMDTYFRQRLQRRFYYGERSNLDVPSLPLTELAVDYFHDSVPEKLGHVDIFSASNVIRRNHVSPCSVVLSMLYAKRLRQQRQQQKQLLQTMSSADVFFISMMMASKYLYDEGVDEEVFNDEWAHNTDQDVDEVNQMETDFLQAMDWKLFVQPHEFEDTMAAIERRLALQEGYKRGWFTYTELDMLMNSDLLWTLWQNIGSECSKLLTAISAAYVTSVFSMMGSTALAMHISAQLSSITLAIFTLHSSALSLTAHPQLANASSPHVMWVSPAVGPQDPAEVEELLIFGGEYEAENGELDSHLIGGFEIDGRGNFSRETQDDIYSEHGSPASTKSSLWILLSQVWAAICIRVRQTHYMEKPGGGRELGEGINPGQILHLKQQQGDHRHVHHQAHRRKTRLFRSGSHKADLDITLLEDSTVLPLRKSPSHCCVCSCSYNCAQMVAAPVDVSAQVQLHCQSADLDTPRLLPGCPHGPNLCVFQVPGHSEEHCSPSVCLQALTDASVDCQFPAKHHNSLLAIPVGFVTSVYQSLMVT